ncbi:MAG: DNA repair protein RecN [Lachnospiraceae bacterium]|nr:DNA repair protein RecN [Lachnospiraceae bacterium]
MLESVTVKNLALIREAEVSFGKGLNILSGETGAGKSIIIGSINYALGAKADKDLVRDGAEYALIELVFHLESEALVKKVRALELPVEEDGTVIITRKISAARSQIRVCGEAVTVKQVRELAALLIDIHGQHEHQSLLKTARHRELLDAYAGDRMEALQEKIAAAYHNYTEAEARLKELTIDDAKRQRELSLAEYEVSEIEAANIKAGEEEELQKRFRRMKNSKTTFDALQKVSEALNTDGGAFAQLDRAARELHAAAAMDDALEESAGQLDTAEEMLRDVQRALDDYMDEAAFDEETFARIEERLDVLGRLTAKYGDTTQDVLDYLEAQREKLEELGNLDATLEKLKARKAAAEKALEEWCGKAHELRAKQALALEKEITKHLEDLNFLKVSFEIRISRMENYTVHGYDAVEFMISLNPGEKKRLLSEVASGGELSRIMLALKSVFAGKDEIETLIFDEIDTGISGKTAWKVSEKMAGLSRDHQLICITHLPQIAAMADRHFLIEKAESGGKTETGITALCAEEEDRELARMLGGDAITEAVLNNAKELKAQADAVKKAV